jgi:hypothetical protein
MDILVGLEYLHLEARVIHRDLKSANVLLDTSPEPRAKLTDFGLARTKSCSRSTVASSAGTSNWTAPEIFNQEGHSYATDVYAAGCVLFELVTGKEPWEGKSEGEIVGAVVQGFRPKLTAAMTLLPVAEEVETLFEGMLQHQPLHRTTLEYAARSVESSLEAARRVEPPVSAMMDHGSVSTPVPVSSSNNLSRLLADLNLDAFEGKLRDFGVETAADLAEVEDAELSEMGFKPLKLRQLRSAVLGVASSPTRMNAPAATLAVPAAVQQSRKVTDEETGVIDEAVQSLVTAEVNGDIGKACWSLVNLILNSSDNKTKAVSSGAVQAAVAAMNSHPNVPDVQQHACQVLMLLTAGGVANGDSDDASKPWKAGVVEAVLRALALHKGVDDVQTRVRYTLLNIIGNVKSGKDGLFYVVVAAMGTCPSVAAVQEWGCLSLHVLIGCDSEPKELPSSPTAEFRDQFSSLKYAFVAAALGISKPGETVVADDRAKAKAAGAIGAVLAAMSTHQGVAAVQEAGCRALLRITSHPSVDASLHVKVGQSGAIQAVLLAMKSHLGVATVQAWACAALLMMTADNIDENAIKATKAGGIEAVLAAMGAHPDVVSVQRWSCGALDAMIVETGSKDADDDIVIKAGEAAGATLAVITAMGAHRNVESLQEFACGALDKLTGVRDAYAKSFIAEEYAAVVEAILRALKSHGAKKSFKNALQISSRNVLHKICVGGACSFDDESDTKGLFEGLVAAMRTYPDSAAMQELACSAQMALNVSEAANRLRASKAGASNAIVAAMGTHLSVADVQSAACRALINMCVQDNNERRASDAGAIEAVVTAMLTHPNMANVQENACWALLNMSGSHDDIKSKAGSAGAIEAAVAAMVALPGEASVQGKACAVLARLTDGVPDNKTKARAAGVMDVVLVARKKHPDNADVQKHGKVLVDRLW